ncbi:hypothetical protein M8494_03990 [Serratia ureilytica]
MLNLLQTGGLAIPSRSKPPPAIARCCPQSIKACSSRSQLSAAAGEAPAKIWQTLFDLAGVKTNDPLPARHFQLLNQFLQVKVAPARRARDAEQSAGVQAAGGRARAAADERLLPDARFNCGANAPLTHPQMSDAISSAVCPPHREKAGQAQPIVSQPSSRSALLNPPIAALPAAAAKALSKPAVALILLLLALAIVLALVFNASGAAAVLSRRPIAQRSWLFADGQRMAVAQPEIQPPIAPSPLNPCFASSGAFGGTVAAMPSAVGPHTFGDPAAPCRLHPSRRCGKLIAPGYAPAAYSASARVSITTIPSTPLRNLPPRPGIRIAASLPRGKPALFRRRRWKSQHQ